MKSRRHVLISDEDDVLTQFALVSIFLPTNSTLANTAWYEDYSIIRINIISYDVQFVKDHVINIF